MARKSAESKARAPAAVDQKTVILRGKMVGLIQRYVDTQPVAPQFASAMRYFVSLGICAHESKHGAIIKGKRWKHEVEDKAAPLEGRVEDERQRDIEEYF